MLLVLGTGVAIILHRLPYLSAGGNRFKQIPAPGLCCTRKSLGPESTRLGFIRKVSHLISKNSRGKGAATGKVGGGSGLTSVLMKFCLCAQIQLTCAVLALSSWISLISTCCCTGLGSLKRPGLIQRNYGKLWFFGLDGEPASRALVAWEFLASGAQKEVCDAIWHQTKQGFGLYIFF